METKWFCIRTISGQEKKVKQYLDSEIKRLHLDHFIESILIPTEKVFEVRNGKKIPRERPYLPGYIFMKFSDVAFSGDVLIPEIVQAIKDVPGIVSFVGDNKGRHPVALREDEVARLLGKASELDEMGEVMENPFVVGETIKVIDGAFSGFSGTIEEINDEKKKLKVMVKIFGRNTPLELSYLQVER
jgi:transcriptional antiterminator NusG